MKKVLKDFKVLLLVVLSVLLFVSIFMVYVVWKDGKNYSRYVLETQTFVKDKYVESMTIPRNEKAIKYMAWYAKVIGIFSSKYREKSMSKWQIADFVRKAWEYTERINLPKNYFISKAVMESGFDPNLPGPCGEEGMFQHHKTVIGAIFYYHRQMKAANPALAKELEPGIIKHEDLRGNPLASLRCQAVIAWGCKRQFHDNVVWWVSASHWGDFRMTRYYNKDQLPPLRFVFYSKTGKNKIDSRNPLKYYFHWQDIHEKFSAFRTDIYRELSVYKKYKYKCSKEENEYIKTMKYANRLVATVNKLEGKIKDTNDYLKQTKSMINSMDLKFEQIYQERIKKENNYKLAYQETKDEFGKVIRKIKSE
jgi:hypothetical protein